MLNPHIEYVCLSVRNSAVKEGTACTPCFNIKASAFCPRWNPTTKNIDTLFVIEAVYFLWRRTWIFCCYWDQLQGSDLWEQYLWQGCKNPGCQVTQATGFCTVALCGSSLRTLLHVMLLVPRILRWLLDFRKMCALVSFDSKSDELQ
jgi:hypothetical protein